MRFARIFISGQDSDTKADFLGDLLTASFPVSNATRFDHAETLF